MPSRSILLVEDNELVTHAMKILLETTGAQVSIAATVAQALEVGRADVPSLVLLDLTLPDGNGLSIVEPLRGLGVRTFVALTGRDDERTRAACLAAGCVDIVVKPPRTRELLGKVTEWLSPPATDPTADSSAPRA